MKIAMHFFTEIKPGEYEIQECYRIGVIEKKWTVRPDVFMDILNPTEVEISQHNLILGELPSHNLLKELLSRI
ncbi:hypothetical protein ABI244_00550 [Serratia ureilytica]|uniref:hypothetical protein n=1 Tax=Serratia ureilytica TaxID=300181 RepID=UPI0023653418|nr:hypothetical protein [Serratia ureilytica]WDF87981.1 hypothetical protein PTZ17_09930 [Serratia ureilytica]